ncbi:SRPBCC family protein [Stappia sp.]|uniref:SRPBCC family protein n=1 Tax=Stappia sp. TaxID=1870903 RepID=UPI003A996BA0
MDLSGEYRINAPRDRVWAALNDADVLRQSIPGCQELEKSSDTEMAATVVAKIGPVKATFKGEVTLGNLNPPESYTITGEGKGGVAGFAKGAADVVLVEEDGETVLTYTVKAQVGGKLAQLGSRLIVSTSRKMADEFFSKFKEIVEGEGEKPAETAGDAVADDDTLDAGVMEEAKTRAIESAPDRIGEALHDAEERVEKTMHEVEAEVETAAGRGAFGGPMVWGLIALGALIVVLALMR